MILGVLDLDDDERLWVPQSRDVYFRPLLLSASLGSSSTFSRSAAPECSPGTGTLGQPTPPLSGAVGIT